jgi:flagellar secretion chaperone FliS
MSYPAAPYAPMSSARPAAMPPRGTYGAPAAASATRYRDAELLTATPGQLVVMLYDKMLLTLRRARVACEAGQIEARCELLLKATDMITELRISLDHDQGGAISAQLDGLYGFMLQELFEANRRQEPARVDVVIRIAGELRDAFSAIVPPRHAGALPQARIA